MDRETSKTLAVVVSQAIDYYPEFGKDPDAAKVYYKIMEEDLAGYSADRISSAFKEWRRENTSKPLSADILKILNWDPSPRTAYAPEFFVSEYEKNWKPPTQEERAQVAEIVAKLSMKTDPLRPKDYGSPDYKHWNMMSDDQKQQCKIKTPTTIYG